MSFGAPLAWAAKVEYCCFRCSWPQEGQCTPCEAFSEAARRTSFSNLLPQSSHRYSKIGIVGKVQIQSTFNPRASLLFYQPRREPLPGARKSY